MRRILIILGCLLALAVLAATQQSQYISGTLTVGVAIQDTNGVAYLKDAPSDGTIYGRQNGSWVDATSGSGVPEAPLSGGPYVRYSGGWDPGADYFALTGHVHAASEITTGTMATGRLGSGSASGTVFLAGDSVWKSVDWDWLANKPSQFVPSAHDQDWSTITNKPSVFTPDSHTHAAGDVTSGVLDTARLGSGTANSSVFLRGDGTWATVTVDPGNTNGLVDAPNDGTFYGRKSAGWVNPDASDIGSGTFAVARLGTGTSGTTKFLRGGASNGSWDTLAIADITNISDFGADLIDSIDPAAGRSVLELGNAATKNTGTGSGDVATGNHTHIIADTSGLQAALDGKAASSHTHAISDTTGLQGALDSKAATNHVHAIADVTGLQGALDSKASTNHTHPDLAKFAVLTVTEVSDSNEDSTFRSVLGDSKTGFSKTLGANTLPAETVLKVEAAGKFAADANFEHKVRLKIGSSWQLEFICNEPASGSAPSGTPWNLTAWVTIISAGASATVTSVGWMDYHTDESVGSPTAASYAFRTRGTASGTLDTTASNAVDLVYAGMSTTATSFSCSHFILQQF